MSKTTATKKNSPANHRHEVKRQSRRAEAARDAMRKGKPRAKSNGATKKH